MRVLALCGRVGRAGLPGALWCASPFPLAALSFCFAWPPPGWGCPPLSRCPCRSSLPWRCALVVFLGLPLPGSSRARASFVSPAWPLAALWWFLPPPFCVSRLSSLLLGALVFFFFFPSSPVRPRCLRLSLVSGPGCPRPRRFALFALLAFRLSALRALVPLSCLPPGWWLLPGGCFPPPPFFSRGFRGCRSVLCAVCCVVLCLPGCGAAPRCVLRCCAVLCCVVLVGCRCLLRRALWRCPLPWGPVLCGAVFCGVPPCRVCFVAARWCVLLFAALLCAVCVPGCCAVRTLSSPLCAVLCFAVLVARVVLFVWCVLLLRPGAVVCRGAVLGLVARGFLLVACFGVGVPVWPRGLFPLWLVWFAVVPCFPVSCSLVLCCRVPLCCCALLSCCGAVGACFALLWAVVLCCVVLLVGSAVFCPVVVSACCGALFLVLCVPCLLRSVRCGALLCWLWCPASLCRVLWRCAVVWCCAVVLCCRFAVLFVWAVGCGLSCCAVLCCWLAVLFFARWWCLRAVVLFSSCCAFPVFSALCAAVPCFPVLCPVVLCCRLVPWCPVLPACWVCFLRGCGCTYLKNRCKIS